MTSPILLSVEMGYFVVKEVEKRISAGARIVLGRIPGGVHLLFCDNGETAGEEDLILMMLQRYTAASSAMQIWERHVAESAHADPECIVLHAYDFPPHQGTSIN
jgi:hypothetical protein